MLLLCLVAFPALAQGPRGTKYAILIACSQYDKTQLQQLPYTIDDVEGFRKALLTTGFETDNIVVLHDRQTENRYRPFKANILKELRLLLSGMSKDDTLVVALSGHGLHYKGEPIGYFCPVDAQLNDKKTLLSMDGKDGLFEMLKACKARQKLLIVNACRNDPTADVALAAQKIDLDDEDRSEVPEGIAAIYSCRQGQKSYYDKDRKRSLFFDHLTKAWDAAGQKPANLEDILQTVVVKTKQDANKTLGALQVPEVRREYRGEWVVGAAKVTTVPNAKSKESVPSARTPQTKLEAGGFRVVANTAVEVFRTSDNVRSMKFDLQQNEAAHDLLFQADTSRLFVLTNQRLLCYNLKTAKETWVRYPIDGRVMEFNNNGNSVTVTSKDGKAVRFNAATGN
jgi:hypothetical protein